MAFQISPYSVISCLAGDLVRGVGNRKMASASNGRHDLWSTLKHPNLLTEARMHRTNECYFKHIVRSRFEAISLRVVGVGLYHLGFLSRLYSELCRNSILWLHLNCARLVHTQSKTNLILKSALLVSAIKLRVFIEQLLGARLLIMTKTRISPTYSNLDCPRQISCNWVTIAAKNPRLS